MKKKNYVSKAVMLGALLAPTGMPMVSVFDHYRPCQNQSDS